MIRGLTRDWGLKIVALVLAVGLWFYAVGEESVEVERLVPLQVKLQNKQMSILKTSARSVRVTLMAPRALISEMTGKEINAVHVIGAEVKSAGEYSFRLEASEVKLPSPQVRIVKIEPEAVSVTLDEVIVQKLPVKPNFVGEPAFGYKVKEDEIQIDPNAVLVEGPKGKLEKLSEAPTERLDLVGRIRPFRRTVQLDLPAGVQPLSEALIDILVPIQEESGEKAFEHVPVRVLNAAASPMDIEVSVGELSFVLTGSRQRLEKLSVADLLSYVDVADLGVGTHEVSARLVLPEDIAVKDPKSLKITVTVKLRLK